jgi:hypothetical protein
VSEDSLARIRPKRTLELAFNKELKSIHTTKAGIKGEKR